MSPRILIASVVMVAALGWAAVFRVTAQTPAAPAKESSATQAPTSAAKPALILPRRFASAEEATEAFVAALRAHDTRALLTILGSDARPLIASGDPVADRNIPDAFREAYNAGHTLVAKGSPPMTPKVGREVSALPIPLATRGMLWRTATAHSQET